MLKRKGADAPEPWLDGVPVTKIRRLDAEVPPGQPFGVGEVQVTRDVAMPATAVGVAPVASEQPMLKRKGAEAPAPWLDGVPLPATKIRRLDAEVPPVPWLPQPLGVGEVRMSGDSPPPAAAVGVAPVANDERAIVVYQPADATRNLLHGPLRPEVLLRVSPDWIHGLKRFGFDPAGTMLQESSNHRALFEELAGRDENLKLAMVPWAPARAASASRGSAPAGEMMEAEDGDGASMEVEQDGGGQPAPQPQAGAALLGEAIHHHHHQQQQWPPQHCVPPQQLQLPAASYQPSPVTWSW